MTTKPRLLGSVLIVLMAIKLVAQSNAEQMEAELAHSHTDTTRTIHLLTQLSNTYDIINVGKVLQYGQELWNLGQKKGDYKAMADAALALSGAYHFDLHESEMAIDWAMRATELARFIGDSVKVANTYYRIASINLDNADKRRANHYLNEAYNISLKVKYYGMMVSASVVLGDISVSIEQKKNYYGQALRAVQKIPHDTAKQVQVMVTLGDFYWDQKETKLAQSQYNKAFGIANNSPTLRNNPEYAVMLAHTCLRLGKYNVAIEIANALEKISKDSASNAWLYEKSLKYLSEAHHLSGNDSIAFGVLQRYVTLHDSLNRKRFNDQVQSQILSIQAEKEFNRQSQQLALLQARGHYDMTIAYVLASAVLLLLGIISYLWRLRRREAEQNEKLGQINNTKDKLLSIISHDVRSPVQALQNIVDLFAHEIATKEDVQTVAKQVSASINNLALGLDNLFYWAQNQQRELNAYPELFNFADLVAAQLDQFAYAFERKKITVDNQLDGTCIIYADVLHARLVFNNVFGNAIKFTDIGGVITIKFDSRQDGYGQLSIRNTGIPIRDEDIPLIFDTSVRYTRPGTKNEPGSGLGLALTQDLMLLNKGSLRLRSDRGDGTLVELIFVGGNLETGNSSTSIRHS